jgi:YidC/Oxa1 family membrane protein insertase
MLSLLLPPFLAGLLSPIENVLAAILEWLHASVGLTWAWSIVALTVLVRIALVPLTVRQIHSMQNLQAHAPEMKELQKRWKHDKQRQNEELMKFYRENKINPAASCLPIVAQIPIFISLFFVLRDFEDEILPNYPASSTEWLDLITITAPTSEAWGPLLLVVYVASQLSSSYLMSGTMQKMQRILLMVLPIVFIPFILRFPSGLMIYWLTTNLWTTGQGLITRRLIPKPPPEEKRSSRTPPKEDKEAPAAAAGSDGDTKPAGGGKAKQSKAGQGQKKVVAGPPRRVKRKRGGRR